MKKNPIEEPIQLYILLVKLATPNPKLTKYLKMYVNDIFEFAEGAYFFMHWPHNAEKLAQKIADRRDKFQLHPGDEVMVLKVADGAEFLGPVRRKHLRRTAKMLVPIKRTQTKPQT